MRTALGVDAGGTSTRCIWLDETGRCLGVGRAGRGNPISAGKDVALSSLVEAIQMALSTAAAPGPELMLITMAGSGPAEELALPRAALDKLGLTAELHSATDLFSSYCSGRADSPGYLLLAGTGAVAGRIENGEVTAISDGLGWLIGDEGSGFWIGREAVLSVVRAMDGRGPQTVLAEDVAADMNWSLPLPGRGLARPELTTLLDRVYHLFPPVNLARFAPAVLRRAEQDEVAHDILNRAAAALLASWRSVQSAAAVGPTVLAGGVLSVDSPLRTRLEEEIGNSVAVADGLVGAGLLAVRALGAPSGEEQRMRIERSLTEMYRSLC